MILIRDEFFSSSLCHTVAAGTDLYQWRYWRPVADELLSGKTFVSILWEHPAEPNFFLLLWRVIEKEVTELQGYNCSRIIANGQVKGQQIGWHTDHGSRTVLYYPNQWQEEWGGSTYFKSEDGEQEVKYKQNRLVIFDANVTHFGSGPSVENVLRISLAFNLQKPINETPLDPS